MATQADRIGQFVDGDWANTSNWTGGVIPVPDDVIRILSGSALVTNIDRTADLIGVNALASASVASSYIVNLGASGNPLILDVDDEFRFDGGGAECWVSIDAPSGAVVNCSSQMTTANAFNIDNRSAAIDRINVSRGRVVLNGSGTFTTVVLNAAGASSAMLGISAGATLTTLNMTGGLVTDNTTNTITTVTQAGGGIYTQSAGTITTVNLYNGRHNLNGGTITNMNAYGGILDLTQSTSDLTITTLHAYSNSTLDLRVGAGTVTVTTLVLHGEPRMFTNDGTNLTL